jgi:hypothetical protein
MPAIWRDKILWESIFLKKQQRCVGLSDVSSNLKEEFVPL